MDMAEIPEGAPLQQRVAAAWPRLAPAEQKVAAFLREHPQEVGFSSASELGALTGTSDATVVRTAKALGYSGFTGLKHAVARSLATLMRPSARLRSRVEHMAGSTEELLDRVFEDAAEVIRETRRGLRADAFAAAVERLLPAEEVMTFGAGPSGIVAEYLALRLNRLGLKARHTADMGFRLPDALVPLSADDVVVIFAPARLFKEIEVIIDHAEEVGAPVVLITDALGPALGDRVAVTLLATLSASGATRETLGSLAVVDALALAVASQLGERALETSELLTRLRGHFLPPNSPHDGRDE
ncbi:MurR/RpiR family transcriptional regulator [Streptomyces rhizosphaericus]|nr:MurR/RpiR family transcriptional regulator [Streptomyces rhizosphaericus]